MPTTKEQAEAYNYEGRRQATSLMTGHDEARNDPRRRINRVTVGGVLIAILLMAGFGLAGFLGAGRGPALPQSGAVLVAGSGTATSSSTVGCIRRSTWPRRCWSAAARAPRCGPRPWTTCRAASRSASRMRPTRCPRRTG